MMAFQLLKMSALALGISAASVQAAQAFVIDFDGVTTGTSASAAAPVGVTFLPAVFDSAYD